MKYLNLSEDNPADPKLDSYAVYYAPNEDRVYYFNSDPYNGHEYVDMGLPSGTLWAKYNVGATIETECGLFFQWGDTVGATSDVSDGRLFNWANYKWCGGDEKSFTKYNTLEEYGTVDDLTALEPEDDAAHINMGGQWEMPTLDDLKELTNTTYTTCSYKTIGEVNGIQITSKVNDNTLFFPVCGNRIDNKLTINNITVLALGKDLTINDGYTPRYANALTMTTTTIGSIVWHLTGAVNAYRYIGCNVRGVVKQ